MSTTSPPTSHTSHPPPFILHPTPSNDHKTTLIILHGTSQTGPELASSLLIFPIPTNSTLQAQPQTLATLLPNTKFVFPTGCLKHTTVLGRDSNAWFDFESFSDRTIGEAKNLPGLAESMIYLSSLIQHEIDIFISKRICPSEAGKRIVLSGFSLGCAVGAIFLLCSEMKMGIGGFVGLSGYLPFRLQLEERLRDSAGLSLGNEGELEGVAVSGFEKSADYYVRRLDFGLKRRVVRSYLRWRLWGEKEGLRTEEKEDAVEVDARVWEGMRVWLSHGEADEKMRVEWGEGMGKVVVDVGLDVQFKKYSNLGHWWNEEELSDVVAFLKEVWSGIQA